MAATVAPFTISRQPTVSSLMTTLDSVNRFALRRQRTEPGLSGFVRRVLTRANDAQENCADLSRTPLFGVLSEWNESLRADSTMVVDDKTRLPALLIELGFPTPDALRVYGDDFLKLCKDVSVGLFLGMITEFMMRSSPSSGDAYISLAYLEAHGQTPSDLGTEYTRVQQCIAKQEAERSACAKQVMKDISREIECQDLDILDMQRKLAETKAKTAAALKEQQAAAALKEQQAAAARKEEEEEAARALQIEELARKSAEKQKELDQMKEELRKEEERLAAVIGQETTANSGGGLMSKIGSAAATVVPERVKNGLGQGTAKVGKAASAVMNWMTGSPGSDSEDEVRQVPGSDPEGPLKVMLGSASQPVSPARGATDPPQEQPPPRRAVDFSSADLLKARDKGRPMTRMQKNASPLEKALKARKNAQSGSDADDADDGPPAPFEEGAKVKTNGNCTSYAPGTKGKITEISLNGRNVWKVTIKWNNPKQKNKKGDVVPNSGLMNASNFELV